MTPPDDSLGTPVRLGPRGRREYGVLVHDAGRVRLVTADGVRFDVGRETLGEPEFPGLLPAIALTVDGATHRMRLVTGSDDRDPGGLFVRTRETVGQFAEMNDAALAWRRVFATPLTEEERREREATAARAKAFVEDDVDGGGVLQTPVWLAPDGGLARLRLAGDTLTLTTVDGAERSAARPTVALVDADSTDVTIDLAGERVAFSTAPPKRGGGGAGVASSTPCSWSSAFRSR